VGDTGVAPAASVTCSRLIAGTVTPDVPYLSFLQRSAAAGGARTLCVAFGVSGFDFGGVIARSEVAVDVLFLFDQQHSSYMRDDAALRAALQHLTPQYERVGAIGSSQSAFGALHYMECVDAVLAISPLDSFVEHRRHLGSDSAWLPQPSSQSEERAPCEVTIHVAEKNFLDLEYVRFCEEAKRRDPEGKWVLRVLKHRGAAHPAYPGDGWVHRWLKELAAPRKQPVDVA
jgi:hypothetical protein